MRRITLWLLSTVAAVVLLFSYRTSTGNGTPATAAGDGARSAAGTTTSSAAGGSSAPASGTPTAGGTSYAGPVAQTRWGPVQVSITVAGNKITSVSVPTYPTGHRKDEEINAYALPILRQETVDAQSAAIDTVSGATVTSDGYKESFRPSSTPRT